MLRKFSRKIIFWCKWTIKGDLEIVDGGMGNFAEGFFLLGGGNLTSDFNHLKFLQSLN